MSAPSQRWMSGPMPDAAVLEPIPERVLKYNPHLDKESGHVCDPDNPCPRGGPLWDATKETANLVTSHVGNAIHAPALDIDIPMHVVGSASGNAHLYFPTLRLDWTAYVKLLVALSEAGIISPNWVAACVNAGFTLLRMPGVPKWSMPHDPDTSG